jgi:hypothetical protein
MLKFNPWIILIPAIFCWAIYLSYPSLFIKVNPYWIFSEKIECNAYVDSTLVVHGIRGMGYNQKVYYHFMHNNIVFNDSYKASNFNTGIMQVNDSLVVLVAIDQPELHILEGVYR